MRMMVRLIVLWAVWWSGVASGGVLDPKGRIHIPIGIPNHRDSLKTFVEADGSFSPGFGTHGIYFWVWDVGEGRLFAPTMDDVPCERGLGPEGILIPWTRWQAGAVEVRTELCQTLRATLSGLVEVVAARVHLTNTSDSACSIHLYTAIRPLGAAGGDITNMVAGLNRIYANSPFDGEARVAVWANQLATKSTVLPADTIGEVALKGEMPPASNPRSGAAMSIRDCSGALRYEMKLGPGEGKTLGFICPVLPGERAVGHRWSGDGLDLARPKGEEEGEVQGDPTRLYWGELLASEVFEQARADAERLAGVARIKVPDPRWAGSLGAMRSHLALCMNHGAADAAVVNYDTRNGDAAIMVNALQKLGNFDLASAAIDSLLRRPFAGGTGPEADNPGKLLWVMGEHWNLTKERAWLERVYPSARKLAALIRYCRFEPGPHWVSATSLEFGDALPEGSARLELTVGGGSRVQPEYSEAFDVAGLRSAAELARAMGEGEEAEALGQAADRLAARYLEERGADLARGQGSWAVLWPARLFPLARVREVFLGMGAEEPAGRFQDPLARAHQGLLAGNREAGWKTLERFFDLPEMRGWYALGEGGVSGVGGWNHVRTAWPRGDSSVAMPHGRAVAEFVLLLRDSLLVEEEGALVLFGGVPPEWLKSGMRLEAMPTHFGAAFVDYAIQGGRAKIRTRGQCNPPNGFVVRYPEGWVKQVTVDGKPAELEAGGDLRLSPGFAEVLVTF